VEQYLALARLEDVRDARLICLLANANRDPKKRPRPYRVEDFLMLELPCRDMPIEDMLLVITAINDICGGTVNINDG
jgi:hypothetical protein